MKVYLLIMLAAAVFTYLSVPLVRHFSLVTGMVAPVRPRDVHEHPTPRLGGVAMLIGFLGSMGLAMNSGYLSAAVNNWSAWGILLSAVAISLLGMLDDIIELDWMTKLAGQVLTAGFLAWTGVQLTSFPVFGLIIGSSRLSLFFTVFVVVAAINAVNFVDGLDGLAAGMIGIGATGLFIYSYSLTSTLGMESYASLASTVAAALVGICVGFLPHNFSTASIFMGDSGSMLLGLLTSAAMIVITGQIDPANVYFRQAFPAFLPILLPVAVVAIPLFDMAMAVVRRLRAGLSPFSPDRRHLHHRLLRAGHSGKRAVLIMYLWTAVFSLGAASLVLFRIRTVAAITATGALFALIITIEALPGLRNRLRARLPNWHGEPLGPAHAKRMKEAEGEYASSGSALPFSLPVTDGINGVDNTESTDLQEQSNE